MKRIIVILALLISAGGWVLAQDTLWQQPFPLDYYYYDTWIDTTDNPEINTGIRTMALGAEVISRKFVTSDTLQIFGIAAMMVDWLWRDRARHEPDSIIQAQINYAFPDDTTFDNCKESLLLYQYHGTGGAPVMQQLGDSLEVHYLHTPVSYYIAMHEGNYRDLYPKPVYERYFTTPQTVYDTFYVGFTQGQWELTHWWVSPEVYGVNWREKRIPFFCKESIAKDYYPELEDTVKNAEYAFYYPVFYPDFTDTFHHVDNFWYHRHTRYNMDYFLFPILTPEPVIDTSDVPGDTVIVNDTTIVGGDTIIVTDTTIVGGDTIIVTDTILSAAQPDLLQRLTTVTPNPAAGAARVTASPGLTRVEAYSTAGTKVYDSPAHGMTATLDVSVWPAGIYLLRIHTPVGATVKRLAVR